MRCFVIHVSDTTAYGKLHGLCGADIGDGADPVLWNNIYIAGNGIGHRNVNRYIILQSKFFHIIPGNKSKTPHIIIIHVGQYILSEFFFVACKGLKKIPGGGIDMFYTRRFFQDPVYKTYYAAGNKKGTEITDNDQRCYYNYKANPIILHPYNTLAILVGEDGYQAVD